MVDGQADRRRAGRQGEDPGPDQRPLLQIERRLDQAPQCRIQLLRVRHRCGADRRAVPPGQLQAVRNRVHDRKRHAQLGMPVHQPGHDAADDPGCHDGGYP